MNLSLYADDHQIYEVGRNFANVKSSLSRNAEEACKWDEYNMLKGNYSKYKTMAMHNKREIINHEYSMEMEMFNIYIANLSI